MIYLNDGGFSSKGFNPLSHRPFDTVKTLIEYRLRLNELHGNKPIYLSVPNLGNSYQEIYNELYKAITYIGSVYKVNDRYMFVSGWDYSFKLPDIVYDAEHTNPPKILSSRRSLPSKSDMDAILYYCKHPIATPYVLYGNLSYDCKMRIASVSLRIDGEDLSKLETKEFQYKYINIAKSYLDGDWITTQDYDNVRDVDIDGMTVTVRERTEDGMIEQSTSGSRYCLFTANTRSDLRDSMYFELQVATMILPTYPLSPNYYLTPMISSVGAGNRLGTQYYIESTGENVLFTPAALREDFFAEVSNINTYKDKTAYNLIGYIFYDNLHGLLNYDEKLGDPTAYPNDPLDPNLPNAILSKDFDYKKWFSDNTNVGKYADSRNEYGRYMFTFADLNVEGLIEVPFSFK